MSTYNEKNIANSIINYKKQWDAANAAGDTARKNQIAESAKALYKQLDDNGSETLAGALSSKGTADAQKYVDTYFKVSGKQAFKPYMASLGKDYGMTEDEINGLTSFNETTGEVSFGGKNLGRASANVDGTTYWDENVLKSAFDDYITTSGRGKSSKQLISESDNDRQKYLRELYEMASGNYLETPEAKAILSQFGLKADDAKNEASSNGVVANGGNIDSFAAANAARQRAAMLAKGQTAAIDAMTTKINNIRQILSDMGVDTENIFNRGETEKNNQVAQDVETAAVTGYVPESMSIRDNIYFNAEGKLIDPHIDYQVIIDDAKAKKATVTDPKEKANLDATIKYATQAKAFKIANYPEYAKYASTLKAVSPDETAAQKNANEEHRLAEKEIDASSALSREEMASNERIANTNAYAEIKSAEIKNAGSDETKLKTPGTTEFTTAANKYKETGLEGVYEYVAALENAGYDTNNIWSYLENNVTGFKTENDGAQPKPDENGMYTVKGYEGKLTEAQVAEMMVKKDIVQQWDYETGKFVFVYVGA